MPETITYSFWNLGSPSNTVEPGGKLLHNTGSPAFIGNEQENKTSQKWKTSREESLLITFRRTYFSQPSRPPALEEAHFLTKAGFHLQRAVFLWPDKKYSTVPQEKKMFLPLWFHDFLRFFQDVAFQCESDYGHKAFSSFLFASSRKVFYNL